MLIIQLGMYQNVSTNAYLHGVWIYTYPVVWPTQFTHTIGNNKSFQRKIAGNIFYFSGGKGFQKPPFLENFPLETHFPPETHFYLICDIAMMKQLMYISNLTL